MTMSSLSSFRLDANQTPRLFRRKVVKYGSLIVGIALLASWLAIYLNREKANTVLGLKAGIAWAGEIGPEALNDEPVREVNMRNGVKFFMPISIKDAELVGDRIAESEGLAFRRDTLSVEFSYGPSDSCGYIKSMSNDGHFRLTKLRISGVNALLGSRHYKFNSSEFNNLEVTNSCLCISLPKRKELLVISYTSNKADLDVAKKIMKSVTIPTK